MLSYKFTRAFHENGQDNGTNPSLTTTTGGKKKSHVFFPMGSGREKEGEKHMCQMLVKSLMSRSSKVLRHLTLLEIKGSFNKCPQRLEMGLRGL